MEDLDKTIEGYKQLYQFLIEFNKMNTFKRKIVIKQLEEQINTLEKGANKQKINPIPMPKANK